MGGTATRSLVRRAFRADNADLAGRVVHGAGFAVFGMIVRTGITIASMAILARLLSPADFGRVVMANVVTELAFVLSSFGLGEIVIQRRRLTRIQLDTVWWASLAIGMCLTAMVAASSFFAVYFFSDPIAGELLRVLGLMFVFDQLAVVSSSLLSRMLMFRQLFFVQVVTLLFRAGSAIVLAWMGAGVWSLVWAAVAAAVIQWLACAWLAPFLPRLRFSGHFLKSTLRVNGSYFGSGLLFYLNNNMDLALIGRSLGATQLGHYQTARSLSDEISARIAVPLQRVLFPAFASVQDDLPRLRHGVTRSARMLALVTIPVGFGIGAVAEELVALLYGSQWLAMIPLLKIIAPAAALRAATTVSRPIFQATNRVGLAMRLNLFSTATVALLLLANRSASLSGFGLIYAINSVFALVLYGVALRLTQVGIGESVSTLLPPVLAGGIMMALIEVWRASGQFDFLALGVRFAILVAAGALTYSLVILLLAPKHVADAKNVLSHFREKSKR